MGNKSRKCDAGIVIMSFSRATRKHFRTWVPRRPNARTNTDRVSTTVAAIFVNGAWRKSGVTHRDNERDCVYELQEEAGCDDLLQNISLSTKYMYI